MEPPGQGPPSYLFLSAVGNQVFLFWKDGFMLRFDARDRDDPKVAEARNLLEDLAFGVPQAGPRPRLTVTDVRPLIGRGTFLVGDTSGRIRAWFCAKSKDAGTTDGEMMVCGHEFPATGSAVTALAVSDRTRMAAAGYADQTVRIFYVTSERQMAELQPSEKGPIRALALAPKDDGLLAVTGGISSWKFDPKHPEISAQVLFSKIWYEGYDKKQYMWQSSGGNDSIEPKYSLIPLIFGTLKATFYSLLFGAADRLAGGHLHERISQAGHQDHRQAGHRIDGEPSQRGPWLPGRVGVRAICRERGAGGAGLHDDGAAVVFAGGASVAAVAGKSDSFSGAMEIRVHLSGFAGRRCAALPVGAFLEWALFAGDLKSWLNGGGNAIGGWMLPLIPICAIVTAVLIARFVNPWIRSRTASVERGTAGTIQLAKFLGAMALTILGAWAIGWTLDAFGLDPRGSLVGPYSQRNALVVGFVMGFAIIPIIYTIAEDALSAVPSHLRAGSLAAGATHWQTAVRIVVPTAMSGLFSAVMIGLGRAVGETMIVLMATGNTPVMDWSVFSGFRTLSACIAVELPEADEGSTHYRTLFLAALTLFAITFVVNTVAEIVRLRFRKRAYQL